MSIVLTAQTRDPKENETLRGQGLVPAVVYSKDIDSFSVAVPGMDFLKIYREHGETSVIDLDVSGKKVSTVIQSIQADPVSHKILHIDFLAVDTSKPVSITVPLEFIGESSVVETGEGTLNKVKEELDVEALPADLPSEIQVDISSLDEIGASLFVKDIVLPKGVATEEDLEQLVVSIVAQREEEEESESGAEIDFSQIEVEKKGKKESEESGESQ